MRARLSACLSKRATRIVGSPVSLRLATLVIGSGCVVAHGCVLGEGRGGANGAGASADEVAAMLRAMGASDVLMALLPQGARLLDGDTAVLQLGAGAPPMELAYNAGDRHFFEAPRSVPFPEPPPGVPLLSATWQLLALPAVGSGRVHLQFGIALLARQLGHDPELVLSWVPSVGAPAPPTPLMRERVATLQAAARVRGNPPGLIDIDVNLGPRPSHGMFIAQVVDGDTLLAAHSVALLPTFAQPVVSELLRARHAADTMLGVAHDLGVLLCGPSARAPGDAAGLRLIVRDLTAWESTCRPALPALHHMLNSLLRELDDGDAEQDASQTCSSPATTATGASTSRPPRASRPPLFWVLMCIIINTVKAVQFAIEGSGAAAAAMALHGLPYVLTAMPPRARVFECLPRALRSVDRNAARRVYGMILALITMSATASFSTWAGYCSLGGDITVLPALAWFERPRSPVLGAAISLLFELPALCLFRWRALASCGQPVGVGQALCEVGLRVAVLAVIHATVWFKRGRRDGAGAARPGKLKAA
ncbi:hypothetical protein FOA52_012341 [Chlamydomonas sp. UWO 241]|nr:hypothetical protein FOA52_012341 [Chlamydomonas sp. UWO 241]